MNPFPLPDLVIGIITYNRPYEIRETIKALWTYIHYSGHITLAIADDCSPGSYQADLMDWYLHTGIPWSFNILPASQNGGWGVNTNRLIQFASREASYLYMTEDDYVLKRDMNLDVGVALLACQKNLGMLRYRATAGTPMRYWGRETDVSAYMPHYREYYGYGLGKVNWLELDPHSETLWLYSNGPHLKRVDFHQAYGLYPEGLKLGVTEEVYAHVVQDRLRADPTAPRIGILPEWINFHFDHIGVSYQFTDLDKGLA